ncbi:MAG: glycosyltransferase, partial [Candidatus Aminicenantes bacterium]|nr:glycosyltransferase [Candidatus Aminicenantes bacterium]
MKNKIVHITSVHSPSDVRIFHKEAKTLAHAGFNVTLIAQHDINETIDEIKILALPKAKNRIHRMLKLPLRAFILAFKQKADIYHFHDPELLPLGMLLKLIKGKKVIYDVHEDYSKQMLSKLYLRRSIGKGIGLLVKIIEYFSSKSFDAIVTATADILKNFSHHKRALCVKNFPIVSNFSIEGESENNEKELFSLIYIGGLERIRGLTQMVKALEQFDSDAQLKLTLCGDFYPSDYEHKLRSLKGFKKVEYLGWVKADKIPNLLKKHDAGIVCFLPEPNHIYAMPNKIFEYMAAGLPVIASSFPLWQEIVEGHGCGI